MNDKCSVLIVDDEVNVLKSLKRLFLETDYKIITAESGQEGLERFENNKIHVVISDYRMPGMDGVEFLRKVKENYPETIRMILSGFADAAVIVDAINDGQVYKFLAKPWNDQDLLSSVKRAIEHYYVSQENIKLLSELRQTNNDLRQLTGSLEQKVLERTRDLQIENAARQVAQRVVDHLPLGIVGADDELNVVYINDSLEYFTTPSGGGLGDNVENVFNEPIISIMREALDTGNTICRMFDEEKNIGLICRPLPKKAGIVATLLYLDLTQYASFNTSEMVGK